MSEKKLLSVIIPAHNEEKGIEATIRKVSSIKLPENFEMEIIVVNDFSIDKTLEIAKRLEKEFPSLKVLTNEVNLGKSRTVKKGVLVSKGDYLIIQDADLEYEPAEISLMINKIVKEGFEVVYGNRFGSNNKRIYLSFYLGNKLLSWWSNLFTYPRLRVSIPDMEVCYKLVDGNIAREIIGNLESKSSFGIEPEITAKLSRYIKNGEHLKFAIVPISYYPRKIEEGKHVRWTDGLKAAIEIVKFNLF